MPIQFVDGKILFVDDKIAMDADCCCEPDCSCDDCAASYTVVLTSPDCECDFDGVWELTKVEGICEWAYNFEGCDGKSLDIVLFRDFSDPCEPLWWLYTSEVGVTLYLYFSKSGSIECPAIGAYTETGTGYCLSATATVSIT